MKKYKHSRREIAKKLLTETYNYNQYGFSKNLVDELLAKEPESECNCYLDNDDYTHEEDCPIHKESDKESKCRCYDARYAGCPIHNPHLTQGKELTKPQEELEVEELKDSKWKYRFNGVDEWKDCGLSTQEIKDKLNQIIKAHNALVKEVKKQ